MCASEESAKPEGAKRLSSLEKEGSRCGYNLSHYGDYQIRASSVHNNRDLLLDRKKKHKKLETHTETETDTLP